MGVPVTTLCLLVACVFYVPAAVPPTRMAPLPDFPLQYTTTKRTGYVPTTPPSAVIIIEPVSITTTVDPDSEIELIDDGLISYTKRTRRRRSTFPVTLTDPIFDLDTEPLYTVTTATSSLGTEPVDSVAKESPSGFEFSVSELIQTVTALLSFLGKNTISLYTYLYIFNQAIPMYSHSKCAVFSGEHLYHTTLPREIRDKGLSLPTLIPKSVIKGVTHSST